MKMYTKRKNIYYLIQINIRKKYHMYNFPLVKMNKHLILSTLINHKNSLDLINIHMYNELHHQK